MQPENQANLWQQEQVSYKALEKRAPEKLVRSKPIEPELIQQHIGITGLGSRPKGFLRYLPHDFIVEEIQLDQTISMIEPPDIRPNVGEGMTTYADLIKIGLGTFEAISSLAAVLQIPPQKIGYAGLKDSRALTSQRISIRGTTYDKLFTLPRGQIMVSPVSVGKGALAAGQLKGNRFTILVRTAQPIDETSFAAAVRTLQADGAPNFYGAQRFGPRLLNPALGKLLCQNRPQDAIQMYLTQSGPFDLPIHKIIRDKAAASFGNWQKMKQALDILPYTFRHERMLLDALAEQKNRWTRALYAIQDQVRFWVYGYSSYLVNQLLSQALAGNIDIPDPLPLALGGPRSDEIYRQYLKQDETIAYLRALKPYAFLQQKARTLNPWVLPDIHKTAVLAEGTIICFSLPKGAYATTALLSLFKLYEGSPVPEWVTPSDVDTKKILGIGSVAKALARLDIPEHLRARSAGTDEVVSERE